MQDSFPLFSSPIKLAHRLWKDLLCLNDIVIDATIGNGKDTLELARILSSLGGGKLWGLDIQEKALKNTETLIREALPEFLPFLTLKEQSHEDFPTDIEQGSIKLIVYNLGYLPGADKSLTTLTSTTLSSLQKALKLICHGGCLSITCYPGHAEGQKEYEAIHTLFQSLDPKHFSVTEHLFTNRTLSPLLVLVQKASSNKL